eukprot:7815355-Pyramimonas_sp.AAC.1
MRLRPQLRLALPEQTHLRMILRRWGKHSRLVNRRTTMLRGHQAGCCCTSVGKQYAANEMPKSPRASPTHSGTQGIGTETQTQAGTRATH